jgi:hypothetical protein
MLNTNLSLIHSIPSNPPINTLARDNLESRSSLRTRMNHENVSGVPDRNTDETYTIRFVHLPIAFEKRKYQSHTL